MKRRLLITICLAICTTAACTSDGPPGAPKNIIVLISDGWGYNHVEAANYYQYGTNGRQAF